MVAVVSVLVTLAGPTFAAQSPRFQYQARWTDSAGAPLQGSHTLFLSLYRGGGAATANLGTLLYSEQAVVTITDGIVSHSVGTGSSQSPGPLTAAMLTTDEEVFLQVAVDTVDNVILPRTRLEPVPFAIVPNPGVHDHSALAASDGSPSPALSVDAAGKVGIGTNTPSALLHVAGSVRATTEVVVAATKNSSISYDPGANLLRVKLDLNTNVLDQKQESSSSQNFTNSSTQTFTPGISGSLSRVEVERVPTASATLSLLDGTGTVLASGSLSGGSSTVQFQGVSFSSPPQVVGGVQYTIRVTGSSGQGNAWRLTASNVYAGGSASGGGDHAFRTYMQGTPALSMGSVTGGTQYQLAPATDSAPVIASRAVQAGQESATDRSELILFHANDNATNPDLITLRSGTIRLQTFSGTGVQDIDNDAGSLSRLTIDETGDVTIAQDLTVMGTASKPGGGSWATVSDGSLKKNVSTISGALEKLLALRGVSYEWKEPAKFGSRNEPLMGMIADEVEKVFPQWVSRTPDGTRVLEIVGFEALAVEAVKELEGRLEAQQKENRLLQDRLNALEARLQAIEERRGKQDPSSLAPEAAE